MILFATSIVSVGLIAGAFCLAEQATSPLLAGLLIAGSTAIAAIAITLAVAAHF